MGFSVFFCVRDAAATQGQYLALSNKAWLSSLVLCLFDGYRLHSIKTRARISLLSVLTEAGISSQFQFAPCNHFDASELRSVKDKIRSVF